MPRHLARPWPWSRPWKKELRGNAKKSVFEENKIDCDSHLLIRGLTPGEDIVEFAKENEVDEIVVGVKRRSKVGKLLMGSTAQYIILQAPCPVVSVK